ncbi:hypothetical protein GOP47_0017755 [Adiantum capillus-veneris]|uniref:C3H1-type domain-containing protein n=1 Tax=Adiantum capillus-veneris TaxID=13818 RepID=A0A9D4UGF7_ADICA|nr:hypothetical protein GOP47_0017755 [Adiantum capillus-veneris]
MAACRILLCGDVRGQFDQLFKRVTSVNKANGPFDALFCVGQFFPDDSSHIDEVKQFVEGNHEIPLPTYFIGDYGQAAGVVLSAAKLKAKESGLIEGIPLCKNLYWLKGSGILHLQGLRVAYLAGKYVASVYQDAPGAQSHGTFHEDDVDALRAFADESDINDFFTNEWPQGILNGVSGPAELESSTVGSSIVGELVAELKPRYHIAGTEGFFYARDPYCNENALHVTRFVGLAAVGNAKKQKFLHALSLTPSASMAVNELTQQPLNTTKSPYAAPPSKNTSKALSNSRPPAPLPDTDGQYWRYAAPNNKSQRAGAGGGDRVCFEFLMKGSCSRGDVCNFQHERSTEKPMVKGACFDFVTKGKCSRGSDCKFRHSLDEDKANTGDMGARSSTPCWFCLASPNVDTDLVVDVGDYCYCAMAKGGLVDGHVLLLPVEHSSSMLFLSKPGADELSKYKRALRKLYKIQGKTLAIFERCVQFKGGTHAHLQVVPIPLSKSSQVRSGFVLAAKEADFSFHVIPPEEDDLGTQEAVKSHVEGENYFLVELPEGTILVHVLDSGENIPIQFGREVCAKILGTSAPMEVFESALEG